MSHASPLKQKQFYETLNISPNATLEDIRHAYKMMALKYHPDHYHGDDPRLATENFCKINEAYNVLSRSHTGLFPAHCHDRQACGSAGYSSGATSNRRVPPTPIPKQTDTRTPQPKQSPVSLPLTLEEIFSGKKCKFRLSRRLFFDKSNKHKNGVISVTVPPGCRNGTKIVCRNLGQHVNGACEEEEVVFRVEELPHARFTRSTQNPNDLVMAVELPWTDSLKTEMGKLSFTGIDGATLVIKIDYPKQRVLSGNTTFNEAGMPIRIEGRICGRGNLIMGDCQDQTLGVLHKAFQKIGNAIK